jgi:hypothetical protein
MPPTYDFPDLGEKPSFANPFKNSNGAPLALTPAEEMDDVAPPKRRENSNRQAFGNRYDFGASLTAAMRSKPPVDRTTLTARAKSGESAPPTAKPTKKTASFDGPGPAVSDHSRVGGRVEDLKPSSLVSSKPRLESTVYQELVDKYCFVSSHDGTPSHATTAR